MMEPCGASCGLGVTSGCLSRTICLTAQFVITFVLLRARRVRSLGPLRSKCDKIVPLVRVPRFNHHHRVAEHDSRDGAQEHVGLHIQICVGRRVALCVRGLQRSRFRVPASMKWTFCAAWRAPSRERDLGSASARPALRLVQTLRQQRQRQRDCVPAKLGLALEGSFFVIQAVRVP